MAALSVKLLVWPALIAASAVSCGKEVGRVPVGLGATETKEIALSAGAKVSFPVHAEKYSYSGRNYVLLHVELLQQDKVVATVDCRGFELEGGAGSGCGAMHQNSACSTEVPAGGADHVRVGASLEDPQSRAEFEGLAVGIRISE